MKREEFFEDEFEDEFEDNENMASRPGTPGEEIEELGEEEAEDTTGGGTRPHQGRTYMGYWTSVQRGRVEYEFFNRAIGKITGATVLSGNVTVKVVGYSQIKITRASGWLGKCKIRVFGYQPGSGIDRYGDFYCNFV